jgi:asparagine synthase (glutamine-hydrolysing)
MNAFCQDSLAHAPKYHKQHLFRPPCYRSADGQWHTSFESALAHSGDRLTWDTAAILSMLSFGYFSGDRTLFREITRQPWISAIQPDHTVRLEAIPPHGYFRAPFREMAGQFLRLLEREVENVCKGRKHIFLLLSGGLDSRMIAGVLAKLRKEGRLAVAPVAVSWGLPDSRDVVYGRMVAELLGFEWVHVDFGPEDLAHNIDVAAGAMNASVSPRDLHRLTWFKNVPREALALSGSYGDSVGRAEFSGSHLLELRGLQPMNTFGLLAPAVWSQAAQGIQDDLDRLHRRAGAAPRFVQMEYEMQGCYTRGLLGHAMSLVNQYCSLYPVFTHPAVYSYMWSIHPAFRFNRIYAESFQLLHPDLLPIPWRRTNRSLAGRTRGAQKELHPSFHDYPHWVRGELYERLRDTIDPDWYEFTGLFSGKQIRALLLDVCKPYRDSRFFSRLLWLAALRRFAEQVGSLGKKVEIDPADISDPQKTIARPRERTASKFWRAGIHRRTQGVRQAFLRLKTRGQYPVRAGCPAPIHEDF